ncbi:response regulator [soil metagenome]
MGAYDTSLTASILMVDDRVENLVALEGLLEPLGHSLVRATSGEEALRKVLATDFAVILLDVQMPGMNGFETANFIKSRERSRHTPIIFLTAISKEEEYVFEGYSVGAVDYMFKPFNPVVLRSKVAVFVDLFLKGQQLHRQGELLRESERRELELQHRVKLTESEARFANIVESARDAIISFGEDRRITLFNAAAEEIFGFNANQSIGRSVDDMLAFDSSSDLAERKSRSGSEISAAATLSAPTQETMGRRAGGELFPVEISVSTLEMQDERVQTVILRDISERRRAEELLRSQTLSLEQTTEELRVLNEELNERTIELERAIGARSRFYANMSHELRTPINAILGYSSLLLDNLFGPLTEKQASSIERTHKAANHLLELVNDVLDLSKIEAGKMELQIETLGFPELLQDLFVTVGPFSEQHGAELLLETESEAFTIVSDARRVRQILLNLLSNAIKFGGGKPVHVVWNRADDGGAIVEVKDQGDGIAGDDQEKIFHEFVQLVQSQESPGTGLGLPISRRLAELLGGSLTLESAPGQGSTFRLSLPPVEQGATSARDRQVVASQ